MIVVGPAATEVTNRYPLGKLQAVFRTSYLVSLKTSVGTRSVRGKMRVVPSLSDWAVGHRVHRRFAARPGAEHIATRRALAYLSAVVGQHPPKTVLEFGTGIGTITYLLLSSSPKVNVVGIEASPFCLAQLERNIPKDFKPRLTIFTKKTAPLDGRFDLIVIDGNLPSADTYGFLRHGTTCFVEGNREQISAKLMQVAQAKNLVFRPRQTTFRLILHALAKDTAWLFSSRLRSEKDMQDRRASCGNPNRELNVRSLLDSPGPQRLMDVQWSAKWFSSTRRASARAC